MYDGTLYGHWQAIVTFQQMIVLADADGIVDMTPQAIAARTSVPLEIIQEGIKVLEAPDPYSRTPDEDGKRIELIDGHRPWGWHIVNHEKYKNLRDAGEIRAQNRERQQRFRDRSKGVTAVTQRNAVSRDVTRCNAKSRYTDTDTDTRKERARARARATPLPESFAISDRVKTWAAGKGFGQLERYLEFFVGRMKASGKTYTDWDEAFMNCIREDWPEFRKQNGHGVATAADQPCVKCGGSLKGGHTVTSDGRLCNPCWQAR